MFFRSNLQETTYVTIGEDSLGIQSYKGQEISVSYKDLTKVELNDTYDFGEVVDGTDTTRGTGGLWRNDTYGEYYLFINKKVDDYIILTTDTKIIVFNYESTNVTDSIYSNFIDLMKEKGLDGQITFTSQKG
jgi:hypothetical protein